VGGGRVAGIGPEIDPASQAIIDQAIAGPGGGEVAAAVANPDAYAGRFGFPEGMTTSFGAPISDPHGPGGWLGGPDPNIQASLQNGPNGQLTVGGMIPLGGGRYLDPTTLAIHGGGSR
jgi:hypothetical protein